MPQYTEKHGNLTLNTEFCAGHGILKNSCSISQHGWEFTDNCFVFVFKTTHITFIILCRYQRSHNKEVGRIILAMIVGHLGSKFLFMVSQDF